MRDFMIASRGSEVHLPGLQDASAHVLKIVSKQAEAIIPDHHHPFHP